MKLSQNQTVRLNEIVIKNYKGISSSKISFPRPDFDNQPDICVFGGPNGIGKSSILECCALLLMFTRIQEIDSELKWRYAYNNIMPTQRLPDLLIKGDSKYAEITGSVELNNSKKIIKLVIDDTGIKIKDNKNKKDTNFDVQYVDTDKIDGIFNSIFHILGLYKSPLEENLFMFFNGFRSMNFSNPKISADRNLNSDEFFDVFKNVLLRLIIAKTPYIEMNHKNESNTGLKNTEDLDSQAFNYIDKLIKLYSQDQYKISGVMPLSDNSYDIRLKTENNETFSIDAMGSGHKEIISTLFLIWYYSNVNSKVIFIDEPELHFNDQWHRKFIRNSVTFSNSESSSQNQLILATHSEQVMASVSSKCRIMLSIDGK